ncbi:O-antigen ligase family protein [Micromonospora fulviviridis]|uniref:O-antigen ligase family protein n=1 Tax=Micromonospora fulviviridis TaxID=47860 RepID=A0ABV2VGN9_9ACTN
MTPLTAPDSGDTSASPPEPGKVRLLLLALLPVLAALGAYATIDLSPATFPNLYRVVVVLAVVPAFLLLVRPRTATVVVPRLFMWLAVTWALWLPVSLFWTVDADTGLRKIGSIAYAFAAGLCVLAFSGGSRTGVATLRLGWTVAFLVTGAIAVWELQSGRHLSDAAALGPDATLTASTFYNPNNYAGFLLTCLPFLVWGGIVARSTLIRVLHAGLIVFWIVLIVATQSRTGFLGALVVGPVAVWWFGRAASLRQRPVAVPVLVLGLAAWIGLSLAAASDPGQRVLGQFTSPFEENDSLRASDRMRVNLTLLGWRLFVSSGLLGRGAGSFELLAGQWQQVDLGGTTMAHNSFAEIAAEFGLPALLPLFAVIVVLVRVTLRRTAAAAHRAEAFDLRMATGLGLAGFAASGLAASSILASPWWWMLLGQASAQAWLLYRMCPSRGDRPTDQRSAGSPWVRADDQAAGPRSLLVGARRR